MNRKNIGKIVASATGLRRMANALQKKYKTKRNVEVDCYVTSYKKDGKRKKTIGIKIG